MKANRNRYIPVVHVRDTYGGESIRCLKYSPRRTYQDAHNIAINVENNMRRKNGFSGTFYSSNVEKPFLKYRRK